MYIFYRYEYIYVERERLRLSYQSYRLISFRTNKLYKTINKNIENTFG